MDVEGMGSEDWEELQRNLTETIPVYDRIYLNMVMCVVLDEWNVFSENL